MENTTPLVTTVTKPATNLRDVDTIPRVNIQEFCDEYYEDILPIIMEKVRHDRRKDVHTRLDFREGPRERVREDSHHSSARARATKPKRVKVQDRLRYGDCHETDSRDPPRGRSRARCLNTSREDHPKDRERFRNVGESYDDSFSHSYRNGNCSRHIKRRKDNKSPLSSVSRSDSSDGRYRRSRSKRHKPTDEDDLMKPWISEEEDPFTLRIRNFESSQRTRMPNNVKTVWFDELPPESIDNYKDLKAAFLAYFKQQNKYVKDPVEIHNIKQKDGETIEDFMEQLTKRLNEHVPKIMEEMMITTTAFIRGEAAAASKKKGNTSWKAHDQSKRQNSDKRTPKEILTAKEGKFQPPSPMVTPVEKRSSNKFCDFHNDKGHSTDECMQLKKQIEELMRGGKLSHLIKEIKHGPSSGTEGSLVIEAEMGGHMIHHMYVDGSSSMEILYKHCFNRLRPKIKSQMVPATTSLTGFSGKNIWALGHLRLLVIIGDTNHSTRVWMNFMIVRSLSPYNGIIGRPGIRAIQALPSAVHGMLKFPVEGGIVTIRSTVLIPTECTSVITSFVVSREERTRPANFKVALHPQYPDQEVAIEGTLSDKGRTELCSILKKNLDIFVWQPSDMIGVPRDPKTGGGRDHERGLLPRLAIQPIHGYHQIQLAEPDEEKTAFHTGQGVYCYTKMPFGLKNAGTTYQRLMDKAFESQIGRNIEVYVDDLVVKSHIEDEMMRDIEETFRALRKVNMKLNLKKCSFVLAEGIFLGYVFTLEGIKPCPDKTAPVLQLPSPRTIKEVQSLNGKLASLNRFLSKSAKKSLPLFQTLKKCIKKSDFHWTAEAEQAFKQLKQHLSELPLLILADFLIEMPGKNPQAAPAVKTQEEPWMLFTDGSSCVDGSGAGLILTNPEGVEFTYALRFQFAASNNEAEYEALIAGLRIAAQMGVKDVHVSVDSKLVANQVLGTYVAKEDNMVKYLKIVKSLLRVLFQTGTGRSTQRQIHKREGGGNDDRGRRTDLDDTDSGLFKRRNSPRRQEGGKKAPPQGPTIRINRRNYLQAVIPYTVVKMRWTALCGIHRPITRSPQQPLTPITDPWPFYKWGIDIAGPFPEGPGKVKFLIVAMDYFTKWIEAKAMATITSYLYGIILCAALSSHGDTLFSLTYGNEAVIPTEIGMPTYRTAVVDVVSNDEELRLNLDLLEERRERAAIYEAKAKSKMTKYYNARVRGVTFKPGDFVYRSNNASHAVAGGKLGPKWEGPYEVTEALGDGAYNMRSMDGTTLPRTWNIANLKRCYL
uniref:Reverse transcriptase domain-containing protein n=1 Tax=Tanacetum cinerariifolium TaxID=118510 RepID=A0A6L2N1F5_TANCI|nr:reverse transcriptase domain-containing protein [Tanacetum cinerariifolium]